MKRIFKRCPFCAKLWESQDQFLSDPELELTGYQANSRALALGLFLFLHRAPACGTTLALEVGAFQSLHEGPVFSRRMQGGAGCRGLCLHPQQFEPCDQPCECAYVRAILDRVHRWQKGQAKRAG
jgi:hypothetical protein